MLSYLVFAVTFVLAECRGPVRVPLNPPPGVVKPLESYNVDVSTMSVSGFSSGGAMAMQYHVSNSADLIGVGIFGGISYACGVDYTFSECLGNPELLDTQELIDYTNAYAAAGLIDGTSNMADDKVYIYHTIHDKTVRPGFALISYDYYSAYTNPANIFLKNDIAGRHGYPHENRGIQCNRLDWKTEVSVNNCGYDGAFHSINHIYGDILKPDWDTEITLLGEFYQYDQTEFYNDADPVNEAWEDIGYIYVPSGCVDKQTQCRLHLHFHGCIMGRFYIGDEYIVKNGLLEVAELNNIIMIYPQVKNSTNNDYGCWDFTGYTSTDFATKNGPQIQVTEDMVKRAAGL